MAIFLCITASIISAQSESNLTPDMSVKLILVDKCRSGDSKKNDRVNYRVDEDVLDQNGQILIRKGTPAYGTVLNSRRAGMLGRRGTLDISVDFTTAVDGQKVGLRAGKTKTGSGNKGLITAGALLVAWPLAFCRGSNVSIDSGTTFIAYINDNLSIKTASKAEKGSVLENTEAEQPEKLLILKNGDRISGKLLSLNNGIYEVKTSLGNISVNENKIERIENIKQNEKSEKTATASSELEKRLEAIKNRKK